MLKLKKIRPSYAWVIVALCGLGILFGMGLCSGGRSMYLTAITEALNIPRGTYSLTDSIRYLTTTIVNLFFGKLILKFGTKKLMCAGCLCLIVFTTLNIFATQIWTFYLGSMFLGVGLAWIGTTMVSTVVNRWCPSNKGAIMGGILAMNGLGSAAAAQILSPIIFEEGNAFGYRNSYMLVTIPLTVLLVLMLIFFREKPKGCDDVAPVVGKKKKARGTGWVGMEYGEIRKKPYFYVTLGCMFLVGVMLQGLVGVGTPHLYDVGFTKPFVATLLSISGIWLTCSKFLTGFLYDRAGIRVTMNIGLASSFFALFGLVVLTNTPTGQVIAACRVFFHGVAMPLETVMLPLFAMDFFGNKAFDKVMGLVAAASTAGFALGSPLGNIIYSWTGNYNAAFILFGTLMVVVTVSMQYVYIATRKDKLRILQEEASKA